MRHEVETVYSILLDFLPTTADGTILRLEASQPYGRKIDLNWNKAFSIHAGFK